MKSFQITQFDEIDNPLSWKTIHCKYDIEQLLEKEDLRPYLPVSRRVGSIGLVFYCGIQNFKTIHEYSKCCALVVKLESGALLGVQVNKKTGKYETTRTALRITGFSIEGNDLIKVTLS